MQRRPFLDEQKSRAPFSVPGSFIEKPNPWLKPANPVEQYLQARQRQV